MSKWRNLWPIGKLLLPRTEKPSPSPSGGINSDIGVFVPVSEIYPEIDYSFACFRSLLANLSLTDTVFHCARLNMAVSGPVELKSDPTKTFGIALPDEDVKRIKDFVRQGGPHRVAVFFRGQILELLRWGVLLCTDHPGDGETFNDVAKRQKLAQALFMASDIWGHRVFAGRFSTDGGVSTGRKRALGTIRKSIEASRNAPDISRPLGRGWLFFSEIFPKFYPSFECEFSSITGLNVEQYFVCLAAILANFMNPTVGKGIFNINTVGKTSPYRQAIDSFLALTSQSISDLRCALWGTAPDKNITADKALNFDYRVLREKPIITASDGRAIILDSVFFSEKALAGPLFYLSKNKTEEEGNVLFGAFGDAFESYVSDILKRMYPTIPGLVERVQCNLKISGNNLEVDILLDNPASLLLFEVKAVWLREDEILPLNDHQFIDHLREKYVGTDKKPKGIGQLARIIRSIVLGQAKINGLKPGNTKPIYPILLTHDSILGAPVYGNILADEFRTLLAPDEILPSGLMRCGQYMVASVIIMTIDDLENIADSIKSFSLEEIVAGYDQDAVGREASFHDYLAKSKFKDRLVHNRAIATKALELMEKTKSHVFGK